MKNWIGFLVMLALFTGYASSQDDAGMDADMMKKMMEHATPGEHHKLLEYYVGEWVTETEIWMAPGEPTKGAGTAKFSWVFGAGKWLKQETTGMMMGMPMRGLGILGYDNFKKKYVHVWLDSMGTSMYASEGVPIDPKGKVSVTYGPMDEYLTGQHDKTNKYVTRRIDQNKFVFEIHDLGVGENGMLVVRITYTRKTK